MSAMDTAIPAPPTPPPTVRPSFRQTHPEGVLSLTVRAHQTLAGAGQRAGDAITGFAARVDPRDDAGAQAAEYAMLSGVGVAIAGACIALLRNSDLIKTLVAALVDVLVAFVRSWFGG